MAIFRQTLTYPAELSVSAPFEVNLIQIKNPTPYTLYIRLGARDTPNDLRDCDAYVMPNGAEVITVRGHEFGFGFGSPTLAYNLAGLPPLTAHILFLAGEIPPQLAVLPVTESIGSGLQTTIAAPASRVAAIYTDFYDVSANVRTLVISALEFCASVTLMEIFGVTSGIRYISINPNNAFTDVPEIYIPFQRSLDDRIQVTINSISGVQNAYKIIGTVIDYPHGYARADGRQKVDVIPFGVASLPVNIAAGLANPLPVVVSPNPLPVTADIATSITITEKKERLQRVAYLPSIVRNAAGLIFGAAIDMVGCTGITFMVQVTAFPGAGTITPVVYTPSSNAAVWSATTALGLLPQEYLYSFYPGNAGAASGRMIERLANPFGDGWSFGLQHSAVGNWTYQVWYWLHP